MCERELEYKKVSVIAEKAHTKLPFYYGWLVLVVASMSMFFTAPGQTYSFTMFVDHFISDFGWSRNLVSGMYTIATITSGCLMLLTGRFIDRCGARLTVLLSATLLAIGCFLNSFVTTIPMLLFGFFINRFAGQGTLSLAASTFAPMWFVKKRGLATMLVGIGGTAAGIIFPLLNNYLINHFGWQNTFRIIGLGIILLFIPVAKLLLVDKPEDLGLLPDNATILKTERFKPHLNEEQSLSPQSAMRTASFWILVATIFQYSLVGTGIGFNYVAIIKEKGFDELTTASIMSVGPIPGFLAVLLLGLILDRLKRQNYLMGFALLIEAILIFILAVGEGKDVLYIRSIISGVSSAAYLLCFGFLKPHIFGRNHIGSISGIIAVGGVVGSGVGPIIFSLAGSINERYTNILIVMSILSMITGFACFFIKRSNLNTNKTSGNDIM